MVKSYSRTQIGILPRIREGFALYRYHSVNVEEQVREFLDSMRGAEATIERLLGEQLCGKRIFEIGPGQLLKNARYFGAHNQVTAIDLDKVTEKWNLKAWLDMLRTNGLLRFGKTLARRVLSVDRAFIKELERQTPAARGARIEVCQGDATRTNFPSGAFDCAISFSVFEHLPDPAAAFREIARLLKPGGVSFQALHCFASDSGAHDPRSYAIERSDFPYWCHLRPQLAHLVKSNAYLNRLRISQWKTIIEQEQPGAEIVNIKSDPRLVSILFKLQADGELHDFSADELTTVALTVAWRKPLKPKKNPEPWNTP
jgi:SAM-dependent methyltransferase